MRYPEVEMRILGTLLVPEPFRLVLAIIDIFPCDGRNMVSIPARSTLSLCLRLQPGRACG